MTLRVQLLRLPSAADLPTPSYETTGSAGMDLRAALDPDQPVILAPGGRRLIPTGFCIGLPEGYEAQVRPRSGLAIKHGVTCLNSPGTIDSDYRGELCVILINHGAEPFVVHRGERIAQMIVSPVVQSVWIEVEALDKTARGEGGFGSTGR
jgi:dUTP pyrophosphatase